MKDLKELAYIVTKNKLKSIKILDTEKHANSKLMAFYEGLSQNEIDSDEEALLTLYPRTLNKSAYRKLKSNLRNHLLNTLFFIDLKKKTYTDRQRAFYECQKDWAAANILMAKNARETCVDLCSKILRYGEEYEFSELNRDVSRFLRLHYGSREGDVKKYEYYKKKATQFDEICRQENTVEELYTELVIKHVNTIGNQQGMDVLAREIVKEIEPIMSNWDTYKIHLYGGLIQLMVHTTQNNYQETILICDSIIHFFERKSYQAFTPLQIAYYQKLVCMIQLRKFENAEEVAEKCMSLIEEGTFNWFKYNELYFTVCMHTEKYQKAYHIYCEVVNHKRYNFLPPNNKEIWIINEAYLKYLAQIETIIPDEQNNHFAKFSIGKFVNETPIFSKDKRGMNIAILGIQILFLILTKKYGKAIDRIEAVEKYCTRYLRQPDTIRSYYFIKMLLTIPLANFHQVAVERKSKVYLDKLRKQPLELSDQTHKIEIINYEKLWTFALDSLEQQFYRKKHAPKNSSSS